MLLAIYIIKIFAPWTAALAKMLLRDSASTLDLHGKDHSAVMTTTNTMTIMTSISTTRLINYNSDNGVDDSNNNITDDNVDDNLSSSSFSLMLCSASSISAWESFFNMLSLRCWIFLLFQQWWHNRCHQDTLLPLSPYYFFSYHYFLVATMCCSSFSNVEL